MTRKIYRTLLGLLPALLMFVGVVTFMSCTEEEGVSTLSGPVPVYLHVSADILGDLNATRAAGDQDPGVSGEFMNTLCVFVVDENGKIEAKFGPDILEAYSDAATGNLTDWTSDKLTLTTGEKTIYAFSNWNNMESTEWNAIIDLGVGASLTDDDLNFVVDDPAGKVNIANGKYIPMSGKAEATVSLSADLNYNQLIDVGLDRLVGKVTIAINGETSALDNEGNETAQAVTLGDLSFEGWADKVPMMSDDPTTTYEYNYTGSYIAKLNQTIAVGSSATIASFYVNETYGANPTDLVFGVERDGFFITLDTNRYGGTYYTATTANKDIPRNYIYPILLTLDKNVLDLGVRAWTDPLGMEEVPYVNIEKEDSTLIVTLLDVTSTFQLTPSMLYNGTALQTVTWNWTYYNTGDGSVCTIDEDKDSDSYGVVTVTSLTATPGYEYGFRLIVDWTTTSTSNVTTTHSRTYTIHVRFVEGWPQFQSPAQRTWRTKDARSEVVNLLLNK